MFCLIIVKISFSQHWAFFEKEKTSDIRWKYLFVLYAFHYYKVNKSIVNLDAINQNMGLNIFHSLLT